MGMGTASEVRENLEVSWFALSPREFQVRAELLRKLVLLPIQGRSGGELVEPRTKPQGGPV